MYVTTKEDYKGPTYLTVPRPDEREGLVDQAHRFGHFSVDTTHFRLREEFYWKKMRDMVIDRIRKCEECRANTREPALKHPAKALEVGGILIE